MSKLDDILNDDKNWDKGYGDIEIFQPELAKKQIIDLVLELIGEIDATQYDSDVYLFADELRQKVKSL